MGLTTLVAQLVFILRAKSWKVFMRYQKSFFIFSGPSFSKHTDLKLEKYLIAKYLSSQLNFFQKYCLFFRGHVFGEAIFWRLRRH